MDEEALKLQLFQAAEDGDEEAVHGLLARGAAPTWANPDSFDSTAVHAAAERGRAECLVHLLEADCVLVDATDEAGWTPLHLVRPACAVHALATSQCHRRSGPCISSARSRFQKVRASRAAGHHRRAR